MLVYQRVSELYTLELLGLNHSLHVKLSIAIQNQSSIYPRNHPTNYHFRIYRLEC